jgi:hypothetical protein
MCSNAKPKFDLHESKIHKIAVDTHLYIGFYLQWGFYDHP